MLTRIKHFLVAEDGAVTVDWVVLTAGIVGLGILVLAPIIASSESTATEVATYVRDTPVGFTPSAP